MPPAELSDLIYDWNVSPDAAPPSPRRVGLFDETLRDGLQSPSVRQPTIEERFGLIHLMAKVGIDEVNVGLPFAGDRFLREAAILVREVFDQRLPLKCLCGARVLPADIEPIVDLAQNVGGPVNAGLFVGCSPIRRYAEGWQVADLLSLVRDAVRFAVDHDLQVLFITEDTTRTDPETIRQIYSAAIEAGATRVGISDTVGHATPTGAARLVGFMRELVGPDVGIDWHGHRDRGMATACALAAVEAGADRVQATALGIGERSGNTSMEQVMVNLQLLGYARRDLTHLSDYCRQAAEMCGIDLPVNQPIVGADAFRTATGVHAAAIAKAMEMGNQWLIDHVYSSVPASVIGRSQTIDIGPMSGSSNVRHMLNKMGVVDPDENLVERVLSVAKSSNHVMSEVELLRTVVGVLTTLRNS